MSDEQDTTVLDGPDDPSLLEARAALEEALDLTAEAAYHIGLPRDILPTDDEGEIAFDPDDLRATKHPSLVAIAHAADAIIAVLHTLPEHTDDEDDEDGEEE
ncbi:MAG: hypothetical protein ACI9MR_002522 [Myxococcota bacterium]|jgi:hypothetical protein